MPLDTYVTATVFLKGDPVVRVAELESWPGCWVAGVDGDVVVFHGSADQLRSMARQILDALPEPTPTDEDDLTAARLGQVEAVAAASDSMAFGGQV